MSGETIAAAKETKRFALFLQQLQERGRSPRTLRAYELDWSQLAARYTEVNQEPFMLERLASMIIFCLGSVIWLAYSVNVPGGAGLRQAQPSYPGSALVSGLSLQLVHSSSSNLKTINHS